MIFRVVEVIGGSVRIGDLGQATKRIVGVENCVARRSVAIVVRGEAGKEPLCADPSLTVRVIFVHELCDYPLERDVQRLLAEGVVAELFRLSIR